MISKLNADIKAAVSLIIQENLSVLRNIVKNGGNSPSKASLKIKEQERKKK